jgi:hypothetical protein
MFQQTLDTAKSTMLTNQQNARDQKYRNGNAVTRDDVKTMLELAEADCDHEAVRQHVRGLTFAYAKTEFYQYKGEEAGNPWSAKLAGVMFWM